ncbi:hypothetical protein [Bacillus sp. NPDC094106]|uniref:hypothetical protein n=1 Tax=Bacillus sp. NPDC094106 TaxID=3363949 RepID=UPI0037FE53C3
MLQELLDGYLIFLILFAIAQFIIGGIIWAKENVENKKRRAEFRRQQEEERRAGLI